MSSNPQNSQPRKSKSKVVNLLAIMIVLLLLVVLILGYFFIQQRRQAYVMRTELTAEKDSISRNLESVLHEYDELETDNVNLKSQLDKERGRVENLLSEIKKVKEISYGKIKQYQRELGTLRAIMRKMVGEIDSLNTQNRALMQENMTIRQDLTTTQKDVQRLAAQNESLNEKVQKGSAIMSRNLEMVALNRRDRETSRARRADKFRACMTLLGNPIAKAGVHPFYLRIIAPDGKLMPNPDGSTFDFNGQEMAYSAKRELDYQNGDIELCIFYGDKSMKYEKGVYKVEVYMSDHIVGETEMLLR